MNRDDKKKKAELILNIQLPLIFQCYLLQQAVPFQRTAVLRIHSFTLVDLKNELKVLYNIFSVSIKHKH